MKTSKQDIQDLLAQLAADIEEIKAMLNGKGGAAGATGAATDVGASSKADIISNDVAANNPAETDLATATDYAAIGNSSAAFNADRILAEVTRLLEPIAGVCSKLPDRIKSYYAQLLLRIPQALREELTRDNDARKRKGQPTVEDKIENSLTMLISIYDRLNQLEDALRREQSANGKSTNDKSAKSRIAAWLKSALSGVRKLWAKQPARWYRKPHILCAIVIYLLYFGFSIYSFRQWHYYCTENTRLRLTADKYRIDSIILRELYPQAAITISAYEHITEAEGAEKALQTFWENNK